MAIYLYKGKPLLYQLFNDMLWHDTNESHLQFPHLLHVRNFKTEKVGKNEVFLYKDMLYLCSEYCKN